MSHLLHTAIKDIQKDMYFGTEVLNRVSFLREDNEFIAKSIFHPSTRFIFFNRQQPLVYRDYGGTKLAILTNGNDQVNIDELTPGKHNKLGYIGNTQFFANGLIDKISNWESILTTWCEDNKNHAKNLRGEGKPVFLFMGLLDESIGLDLKSLKSETEAENCTEDQYLDHQGRYQGIAYYAVDVTRDYNLSDQLVELVNKSINEKEKTGKSPQENGIYYTHSRKHFLQFEHKDASLYSHGAMFFNWLKTNKFCPGCGHPTIPIHAGGKLVCTNEETLPPVDKSEPKFVCPVKKAPVSNVSFPRTDMAIISIITNRDRSKILLSLGKRHASAKMYSCTAGFMEPSETVEVATKREIWEETGVNCEEIQIVMTQPWPFPQNLMIGCIGVVDFNGKNELIHLDHDNELLDARWFDTEFVRKLVYSDEVDSNDDFNPEGIMIPIPESIAFTLIKLCVDEESNKHKL
ncbi:NPY1 [Candida oxycetoniae]|uniref:NAD(+) diphosphatase n=1 Tax=Candida oxycetoniae TaxID=497107 RepID=A0AAI9WWC9_9ASCO|nr:NPY1 [Candida oxycetoniae]KAI3403036.2 NPY1 [Candida oxycetoniae]